MIRFGPAGNSDSFYEQGYKSSVQMPAWLRALGLDAYEYQGGRGIKINEATARELGKQAKANDIFLSIHAPYYINLANDSTEGLQRSKRHIFETLKAAKWMDAARITVHTGSPGGLARHTAFKNVAEALKEVINEADEAGFADIAICPETMGKINQIGSLEEIVEICTLDERLVPTIDFGHLYARSGGRLNSTQDFEKIMDVIENNLGTERLNNIHCHFSRIEYTAGGEKRHLMIEDTVYGPEFGPLAEVFARRRMEPVVICESMNYMAEDALKLKKMYESVNV